MLCQSFVMRSGFEFNELIKTFNGFPKPTSPILITDRSKYFKHVASETGILHIEQKNIIQFSIRDFDQTTLGEFRDLFNKEVYWGDEKNIELRPESVKWIVILDPSSEFGLLFYHLEFKIFGDNCLQKLAENNKHFRYLKDPGNQPLKQLKVYDADQKSKEISLVEIFEKCVPSLSDKIEFLNSRPVQFHYLDKNSFLNESERESYCYNLLRIPASPNKEIEKKYFLKNQNHIYENSSLFSFVMSEGAILTSPYKSPKQLVSNFFTAQILALLQKERIIFLLSNQAKQMYNDSNGSISRQHINRLKEVRKVINLTSFFSSMPISQYSEIQEVYSHLKNNFLSGADFIEIKGSINEVSMLIQEEAEQESIDRERKIGLILGVLGITGFISFIFDYLIISKNQKLIDTLEFPLNALPFFLFLLTFVIIWRFLNTKKHD
jgi:hypothetical protein